MPRALPLLFALTLTACGTSESTVDDDNTSSNGAIASGPDTGMTAGSGSTDTGGGTPGTAGCEVYDPVAIEAAPDCPEACPNPHTYRWVGGCPPTNTGLELDDTSSFVRIGCSTQPQDFLAEVGAGSYFAFVDGSVGKDRALPYFSYAPNFGGQLWSPDSDNFLLAESCAPLGVPDWVFGDEN